MIIKLDMRETALLHQLLHQTTTNDLFKDLKIKTENLPIGDVIIHDEIEERIIIERKTISDLMSSIKDGRYEEQSYRLNGTDYHNHNIYYLIEGEPQQKMSKWGHSNVDSTMLYSAMFSLNYYKGFSLLRSRTLEETAKLICHMAYKIGKDIAKPPYYANTGLNTNEEDAQNQTQTLSEKDYVNVVKKTKKDNITPENVGELMLCQIPGISSVTAVAIMEKFKTISNLIQQLETNPECLTDLSYKNSKGQVRKINKTSLANVAKFIINKENDVETKTDTTVNSDNNSINNEPIKFS